MSTEVEQPEKSSAQYDSRWLKLLLDVALIANGAESVEGALLAAMSRVCRHNGWDSGYCHIRGRTRNVWWVAPADGSDSSKPDDEARRLARDWAVQVMEAGRTQFIDDCSCDTADYFQLPGPAPHSGGAIATPLLAGQRTVGAMVFYSSRPLSDPLGKQQLSDLLRVVDSIGTQMGRVLERWHLSRRITEEAEKEREALGREIHDRLAQQLVGVKLLAQNLRRAMQDSESDCDDRWDLLNDQLTLAQEQTRALARGLSGAAFWHGSDSLIVQLGDLTELIRTGHGVQCRLDAQEQLPLEDELTKAQLWRIAREAVFNALQHADPTRIDICLRLDGDQLILEIRDDGTGLPSEPALSAGMGLAGMRHRAELVGARLELKSRPGKGTIVRCVL